MRFIRVLTDRPCATRLDICLSRNAYIGSLYRQWSTISFCKIVEVEKFMQARTWEDTKQVRLKRYARLPSATPETM